MILKEAPVFGPTQPALIGSNRKGRTLITITRLSTEIEANPSAFRGTLRRSEQHVFDGPFAAARRHIAAMGQAESLLPEQDRKISLFQQELEELKKKHLC